MNEGIIVVIMAVASSAIGIVLTTSTGGADMISGGPCNDNNLHSLNGTTSDRKVPDGHQDFIDCGPGNDFAVVNVSGHLILAHRCCPIPVNNTSTTR